MISGPDLDRVHVETCENHTSKKYLVSGRDLVNFGPYLFGYHMAPIFVILFADLSFLLLPTSHTTQAQLRSQLQFTLPCCRFCHPTGGGGPRSEGGSNTSRRRGDRGIAAAKTAALAPWARPPMRCVRAGAALIASDWEGFDACGEEDCGERPARDGDDAGTGGSRRVAAPRPHRQQLRGLDATAIIHNLRTVTPRYGELLALLVYLTLRYVDYEC